MIVTYINNQRSFSNKVSFGKNIAVFFKAKIIKSILNDTYINHIKNKNTLIASEG